MQALRQMNHQAKRFQHSAPLSLSLDLTETDLMPFAHAVRPAQFYCSPVRSSQTSGEMALMHAILEDAIDCFRKQFISGKRRDLRLAREAEEWIFDESVHWPFSFINICTVLGLDPGYIRAGLKRWRQYTTPRVMKSARHPSRQQRPLRLAS